MQRNVACNEVVLMLGRCIREATLSGTMSSVNGSKAIRLLYKPATLNSGQVFQLVLINIIRLMSFPNISGSGELM